MSRLFQLVYSTAYSLDESLIPTGFIQLLIPWMSHLFHFNFLESKAIAECDFCSVSIKLNFFFSSFTGASNARFDGMVETSMTFSTCVVYNIWCLGTFNFWNPRL